MTRLQSKKDITSKVIGYKKRIIICSFLLVGAALIVCTVLFFGQGSDPGRTKHHVNINAAASTTDVAIADSTDDTLPAVTLDIEIPETGEGNWQTNTTQQWMVDTPAYDETAITGYVCKHCNSKKAP